MGGAIRRVQDRLLMVGAASETQSHPRCKGQRALIGPPMFGYLSEFV
jgi:hypothetical protein